MELKQQRMKKSNNENSTPEKSINLEECSVEVLETVLKILELIEKLISKDLKLEKG